VPALPTAFQTSPSGAPAIAPSDPHLPLPPGASARLPSLETALEEDALEHADLVLPL